ncbi:MAG TPA: HIT family protein, partial [Janthinobacterium sp.]|nr:HIT family protein [Janthinobacterium sp.]
MTTMPTCELCELLDNIGEDDDTSTVIWCNARVAVLAVDDAAYPGFCRVVWQVHVKEMSELDTAQRALIMEVVWRVELALRAVMLPEKINLASLGNMTPHVHWHVIPRYLDDAHFPQPIW